MGNEKPSSGGQTVANFKTKISLIADFAGAVYKVSPQFTKQFKYTVASFVKAGGLEALFENQNTYTEIIDSVQNGIEWEGHMISIDEIQDEYVCHVKAVPVVNSNKDKLVELFFSDITPSKRNQQLETRLLKAITQCTEILFSNTEPDVILPDVLSIIGKSMEVDRCYIYNIFIENDNVYAERWHEWVKKPALNTALFKQYKKFDYNSFFEVLGQLNAGRVVVLTPQSKINKSVLNALTSLGIFSFLKVPIFKNNNLWGYIGFEDTENYRNWSYSEKRSLKTLAQNIGAFLKINSLTEELLSKNLQLENAIAGASDGLWVANYENNTHYISPRVYQIFGYEPSQWPTEINKVRALLKTEDTERLEEEVRKAVAKKQPLFDFDTVAKHQSGKYIWVKGTISFSYDKKGKMIKNSGSVTDVSTEKTYELKIKRQGEHYQRLVNSLKEVVFETDKQGNITLLNTSWKTLTGKNIKDSVGKKLSGYIHKSFVSTFEDILQQLRDKKSWPGRLELQIIGNNKQPYWVELWLRGMYDSNYELTGISGSIFDINSQKLALSQLRESEERYRLISENTKDIVCLHNLNGSYVYTSPSMFDILGYQPKELIGKPIWALIHPDDAVKLKKTFALVAKGKQVNFVRYRKQHSKGHYIWVETIANLQQQNADTATQPLIQTATRDISQQKKAEEEIKNALEKERHLVELRTNLINMISHEFRTPLTTIKSSSDLLLKYLPSLAKSEVKDRFEMHFERIRGQVNRINELISGVLILGRMDTGKIQFLPEPVDFESFISDFLQEYQDIHPEDVRHTKVFFEGTKREVEIDKLLVSHILRNLVSNALKYSQGRKNPELYVKFEKKRVKIIIKDYGIGIAEKDLKNLFQSFYRGENALTIPGTGLGLVIVKQFVDMHGGEIKLSSQVNTGTTIEIILPI